MSDDERTLAMNVRKAADALNAATKAAVAAGLVVQIISHEFQSIADQHPRYQILVEVLKPI